MEKNIFYVYKHINPKDNEIFYIGMGKDNRAWTIHSRNKWWNNYVNKNGFEVEIICDNMSRQNALELEITLISFYGRKCHSLGPLLNLSDGGETCMGYTHSQEWKDEQSKLRTGKKLKPLSEEAKSKISQKQLGKQKSSNKIVRQYDLEGNLIQIFRSSSEAKKETGINGISENATGYKNNHWKSVGGYVWIYEKDYTAEFLEERLKIANSPKSHPQHATDKRIEKCLKPVIQYDLNGNLIKEWGSIKEASVYYGIHSSNIGNCCRGTQGSSKGYLWKFKQ